MDWHRDHVYYDLTPTNNIGSFDNSYSETITEIRFLNPEAALSAISDQVGDPIIHTSELYMNAHDRDNFHPNMFWTEGYFESMVIVLINGKNGVGSTISKKIDASPQDLFEIKYTHFKNPSNSWFVIDGILPKRYKLNVEILPWNLDSYSTAWKFEMDEMDPSQETNSQHTISSEFATNFEFSVEYGEKVKVGLKFGASQKTTETSTFSVKTELDDDFLGQSILSFDQPIIVSRVSHRPSNRPPRPGGVEYRTREITFGNVLSMSVEPVKQF